MGCPSLRDSGLGRPTTYARRGAYQAPLTPSLEKLEVRLLGLLGKERVAYPSPNKPGYQQNSLQLF